MSLLFKFSWESILSVKWKIREIGDHLAFTALIWFQTSPVLGAFSILGWVIDERLDVHVLKLWDK